MSNHDRARTVSRRQFLRGDFSGSADAPVRIGTRCLAFQGIVCRSCGEACEPRAIRFRDRRAAASVPEIDAALCTACGACADACPASAIEAGPRKPGAGAH